MGPLAIATGLLGGVGLFLLGVAIVWPLRGRLVRLLAARFRSREEDESTPRFLDQNVVGTPDLALAALARELGHTGDLARRMACSALTRGPEVQPEIALQRIALQGLHTAVSRFTAQVGRGELPEDLLAAKALALRASGDQAELAERAVELAGLRGESLPAGAAREAIERFESEVLARVEGTDPTLRSEAAGDVEIAEEEPGTAAVGLLGAYETAKDALLRAVTRGELPAERWSLQLDRLRVARGIGEYSVKGSRRLGELESAFGLPESPALRPRVQAP